MLQAVQVIPVLTSKFYIKHVFLEIVAILLYAMVRRVLLRQKLNVIIVIFQLPSE